MSNKEMTQAEIDAEREKRRAVVKVERKLNALHNEIDDTQEELRRARTDDEILNDPTTKEGAMTAAVDNIKELQLEDVNGIYSKEFITRVLARMVQAEATLDKEGYKLTGSARKFKKPEQLSKNEKRVALGYEQLLSDD